MFKFAVLPLRIAQLIAAVTVAIGCFLGFPNDATLSGAFWSITAVLLASEVTDRVLQIRRSRKGL